MKTDILLKIDFVKMTDFTLVKLELLTNSLTEVTFTITLLPLNRLMRRVGAKKFVR